MKNLKISTIFITIFTIIFIIEIFFNPLESTEAAKYGLLLWYNKLIPSLLPFIIASNILIGVGGIAFFGTLLENIFYKLFNIPDTGIFPCIMGLISGCPLGAKITADLRVKKDLSHIDTIKVMSICNNSSPLFILGTVGVNMFKRPIIGAYIMLIIYFSVFSTGIIFSFYGKRSKNNNILKGNILINAYNSQIKSRENNFKAFGTILGESINNSMEIILKIGGFVIFFSVFSTLLQLTPLFSILQYVFMPLLKALNINWDLFKGFLLGIIEITNGIDIISRCSAPLKHQLIACTCLISWCGLSIHAQIMSMINHSDIDFKLYIMSKLIQVLITFIYSVIVFNIFF